MTGVSIDIAVRRNARLHNAPVSKRRRQSVWDEAANWRNKGSRHNAATLLQRIYRKRIAHQLWKKDRALISMMFAQWVKQRRIGSREWLKSISLDALSRVELDKIAIGLGIPHSGKKQALLAKLKEWVELPSTIHNLSITTASIAANKRIQVNGTVYCWNAIPGTDPYNIRPLQAQGITKVAANFDSEAMYAIDETSGAAYLCKTGGSAGQIGLCSTLKDTDTFGDPLVSQWIVNPVALQALSSDHIVDIQVARHHCTARSLSGELYVWGNSAHGELGLGEDKELQLGRKTAGISSSATFERIHPRVVPTLEHYTCINMAVGPQHTVAVCDAVQGSDGAVFVWGSNSHHQLGIPCNDPYGNTNRVEIPTRLVFFTIKLSIVQVSCGTLHTVARTTMGQVYSWGTTDGGRLGHTTKAGQAYSPPQKVEGLDSHIVLDLCCGAWHTAIVATFDSSSTVGKVYCWGDGNAGQLGLAGSQRVERPARVQLPPMKPDSRSDSIIKVACGMYHTVALTNASTLYSWGSPHAFSPLPRVLRRRARANGDICSVACGRTFTVFCVLPISKRSYDIDRLQALNPPREIVIPPLPMDLKTIYASKKRQLEEWRPIDRLMPQKEKKKVERVEKKNQERIDAIDIYEMIHPLCRMCWKCDGFMPSARCLSMCLSCKHSRDLHGKRSGEFTKDEAIRILQGTYRAKRARFFIKEMVRMRYQRVFDIESDSFYYYNTWSKKSSWHRPKLLDKNVDVPMRDPDDEPQATPPATREEAARMLQAMFKTRRARFFLRSLLEEQYVKKYDDRTGQSYYYHKTSHKVTWEKPILLRFRRGDDLGMQRSPSLTKFEAATKIQSKFRTRKSVLLMKSMVRSQYTEGREEVSNTKYYTNKRTESISWKDPVSFGSETIFEKQRELVPINDRDDGAVRIQRMFRARKARKWVKSLLELRFQAILDPVTGKYYYYDAETKKVSWKKPKMLRSPKKNHSKKSKKKKHHGKKHKGKSRSSSPKRGPSMSPKKRLPKHFSRAQPNEAARSIQGMIRSYRARKYMHSLLYDVYDAHVDPKTKKTYYHNKRTGNVSWIKPKLLRESKFIAPKVPVRKTVVLTREDAARKLQGLFRRREARKLIMQLVQEQYEKVFDPNTKEYFYFNRQTNASSWHKPKALRWNDLTPTAVPKTTMKDDISDDSAAVMIQGLFRLKRARAKAMALVQAQFEKVWDIEREAFYYFNVQTGQSQWTKPKVLGDSNDVINVVNASGEPLRTPPSPTSAALSIQKHYRRKIGHRKVQAILRDVLEKHYDPSTQTYFYFNTKTKTSCWEKPTLMGSLEITPFEDRVAAITIQSCFRRYRARSLLQKMLSNKYQKHWDEESERYFFFDTTTNTSSWKTPRLLHQ